jgi:hypothetical protein
MRIRDIIADLLVVIGLFATAWAVMVIGYGLTG